MRYHLVAINSQGYSYREAFEATPDDAHRRHVAAWADRKTSASLVMRRADGRRFSVRDSEDILKGTPQ